jgi:hypothetical protein
MALVYEGLTKKQEAVYFKKLNGANGEIRRLRKTDIHNASVAADDKTALEIQSVAEKYGFSIDASKRDNQLAAISTVEKIYKKFGLQILDDTLVVLRMTWNGDKKSLDGIMLEGIAEFMNFYRNDAIYSHKSFVSKMQRVSPVQILREAITDTSATTKSTRVVNTLFRYYNKGNQYKLDNKHYMLG